MFEFNSEQVAFQRAFRHFVEREIKPHALALERGEMLPYEIMRKIARTFGLAELARKRVEKAEEREKRGLPRREEGPRPNDQGFGLIMTVELSRVSPGLTMAFGATVGLFAGAIMARGTAEQRRLFALPALSLEKIGAWAITEPGAGSDAFGAMKTVATPDGDNYQISGHKTFITNAPFADHFLVYAKIDRGQPPEERPIGAFILDRGMAGLATSKPMAKMGMHSSPTGEIFLDNVMVGRERLLGGSERAGGREGPRQVFRDERSGIVPMALGIIERCLEESVQYARQRVQFGRPIAEYQLIQEKIARMAVARENVRNLFFKMLCLRREGRRLSLAEASTAKLYAARAATEVALEAVQVFGGNGYMQEYAVEGLARDAKLLQIGAGTDEIQIVTIANSLLQAD